MSWPWANLQLRRVGALIITLIWNEFTPLWNEFTPLWNEFIPIWNEFIPICNEFIPNTPTHY